MYKAILKLKAILEIMGVPFDFENLYNGYHLMYPSKHKTVCSVIEHDGSYGRTDDLLEIMGLLTEEEAMCDDVAGYLQVEDVFARIMKHWREEKPE